MTERYAIYYAPATDHPLWDRAGRWIGRDAATGKRPAEGAIPGIAAHRRHTLTASARRYGFHATLKSPFLLAGGARKDDLLQAVAAFCEKRRPVEIGRLKVSLLGDFLALVPEAQSDELGAFAAECVVQFDRYRAPLTAEERERRLNGRLDARHIELLDAYGYPYVLEQFRFHMTVTDRLTDGDRAQVIAAAENWFAPVLNQSFLLDRLLLFHEATPGGDFIRTDEFALGKSMPADA